MLTNIFTNTATGVSLVQILIASASSLFLGFVVAYCRKLIENCTKSMFLTIMMLPLVVMMVIILVNGNLGLAVAIHGALGLVRFRSMPASSKDILFVFLAFAIGLATGIGYVGFGFIITFIAIVVMFIFSVSNMFYFTDNEQLLKITMPESIDYSNVYDDLFEKYLTSCKQVSVKTTNMGSLFELTYRVSVKKNMNEKELIDEIRIRNGNLKVSLSQNLNGEEL